MFGFVGTWPASAVGFRGAFEKRYGDGRIFCLVPESAVRHANRGDVP